MLTIMPVMRDRTLLVVEYVLRLRIFHSSPALRMPSRMTHVGLCTQEGPEQRKGEIRIEMIGPASRLKATMLFDGEECGYSATLSDAYKGTMTCPRRPAMPLTLWVR